MRTAWIIELKDNTSDDTRAVVPENALGVVDRLVDSSMAAGAPVITKHVPMWIANYDAALQFARKQDAELAALVLVPGMDVVICEHVWS